jgi:hypothetical protein
MPDARKLCKCGHGSVFTSKKSHRNRFLLFVKHLAVSVLTRKYRKKGNNTQLVTKFRVDVCLSRRWSTFSSSYVKLFCKFLKKVKRKKLAFLVYIYVTKAFKYCCTVPAGNSEVVVAFKFVNGRSVVRISFVMKHPVCSITIIKH